MATISANGFLVDYPDDVWFKWSPVVLNIIRLSSSVTSIKIVVDDLEKAESIQFIYAIKGNTSIDISRALQWCGANVEIQLTGSNGGYATIQKYLINGALRTLDTFGGDYSVRLWPSYPLNLPFLVYDSTIVHVLANGNDMNFGTLAATTESGYELLTFSPPGAMAQNYKVYAEAQMYVGAAWETSYWRYNIQIGCDVRNPIYLRWVDAKGLTWYWLFDIVETSIRVEDSVEYGRIPGSEGSLVNDWGNERGRVVYESAKIMTSQVTSPEYKVLKTLASSAIVDAYDKSVGKWFRVRIANGDNIEPKGNYKEVEYTIEYSPYQTQIP
jgi:hypothetical protein